MEKDVTALCAVLADDVDFIGMPMRNLVVGLVERGQIVPDEAEAWAREAGEEPFAQTPALAKYDPMTEPDWTLAMATAWIVWRTPEAVRRVWDRFLQGCTSWEWYEATLPNLYSPDGRTHVVGFKLVQPDSKAPDDVLRSATVWTAMAKASPIWCPDPPLIGADQADSELRAALRVGSPLVARHGAMAEVIERHVWGSLSPFDDGRGGPEDVHDRGGVVRFHRVRVERDAVLAVWPAISAAEAFALAVTRVPSMLADGTKKPSGRPSDAPTPTMQAEEAREFIAKENPPSGLSSDALVAWVNKKAAAIGRKIHRNEVRAYHRSGAYVGTTQRGRPRKSAD